MTLLRSKKYLVTFKDHDLLELLKLNSPHLELISYILNTVPYNYLVDLSVERGWIQVDTYVMLEHLSLEGLT